MYLNLEGGNTIGLDFSVLEPEELQEGGYTIGLDFSVLEPGGR